MQNASHGRVTSIRVLHGEFFNEWTIDVKNVGEIIKNVKNVKNVRKIKRFKKLPKFF